MPVVLAIFSGILILLSVLTFISHHHWVYRAPEFLKQQLLISQVLIIAITFLNIQSNPWLWCFQFPQIVLMIYHAALLFPFTPLHRRYGVKVTSGGSMPIKLVFCNVEQQNDQYDRFREFIIKENPHIFLTMESNHEWEQSMKILEKSYPHTVKVTLDNTYGMHFYSQIKIHRFQIHFFVADDVPSIEAELHTEDGYRFVFFGLHPPPPSPTEEENSLERDGDLLSAAKRIQEIQMSTIVAGDFNNVAWARSSVLFRKSSNLIDARIGRKILSSFHTRYWFFRVPLDLLFHSSDIAIDKLFRYPSVGSDHFPIGCTFHILENHPPSAGHKEPIEEEEELEIREMIAKGQEEESENR